MNKSMVEYKAGGIVSGSFLQQQMRAIKNEADAELENINLLALTYKEICKSEIGRDNSLSLITQIKNWKKALPETDADSLFLLINANEAADKFIEYVLAKYTGKKRVEFEKIFDSPGVKNDIYRLIKTVIYEHKSYLEREKGVSAFFNIEAKRRFIKHEIQKVGREFIHEAMRSAVKICNQDEIPVEEKWDFIVKVVSEKMEQIVDRVLPGDVLSAQNIQMLN